MLAVVSCAVTLNHCLVNSKAGRQIPEGWGIDDQGAITTDPNKVLVGGALPALQAAGRLSPDELPLLRHLHQVLTRINAAALAAGALQPRQAFPYAFNSGADFILVGMFDWQIEEDAKLARRVVGIVASTGSKRTRPWFS